MISPHPQVLDRTIEPSIRQTVSQFADLLDETVNLGTNIFASDMHPASNGEENIAPTMLFRHFVDLLDSISILTRAATADPSKVLLRAAFEVLLNLEYLFEKDTHKRAVTYLFCDILNQIKVLEKLDPSTDTGKAFKALFATTKNVAQTRSGNSKNIRDQINRKWAVLQQPRYTDIFSTYVEFKKNKVRKTPWYRYDSQHSSIEQLAKHLNRSGMYELYYRKWSGSTHGTDVYLGKVSNNICEGVDIIGLRSPKDLQEVTQIALTFSLLVFELYVKNRVPSQDSSFNNWRAAIASHYKVISGPPLIIVK